MMKLGENNHPNRLLPYPFPSLFSHHGNRSDGTAFFFLASRLRQRGRRPPVFCRTQSHPIYYRGGKKGWEKDRVTTGLDDDSLQVSS